MSCLSYAYQSNKQNWDAWKNRNIYGYDRQGFNFLRKMKTGPLKSVRNCYDWITVCYSHLWQLVGDFSHPWERQYRAVALRVHVPLEMEMHFRWSKHSVQRHRYLGLQTRAELVPPSSEFRTDMLYGVSGHGRDTRRLMQVASSRMRGGLTWQRVTSGYGTAPGAGIDCAGRRAQRPLPPRGETRETPRKTPLALHMKVTWLIVTIVGRELAHRTLRNVQQIIISAQTTFCRSFFLKLKLYK